MSGIPRIFHRIWLGQKKRPEAFDAYWQRFKELNPGWQFLTWTDDDDYSWMKNRDLMETRGTPSGMSDVLRIELLARHGGVYVDCDMEPLKSFEPLLDVEAGAFAAWELPDKVVSWGAFGAVPEHPAVVELRSRMPAWVKAHAEDPPNLQTGPGFLTHIWRQRDDVYLHPPQDFYPIPFSRRAYVHPPYPKESFAVHHWAHSWAPKTVVLVPWRGGDTYRDRNWSVVRRYLEALKWPIFLGDRPGPWSRAAAINAASEAAGDWDVAVVCDADTIQEVAPVKKAVASAASTQGAVMPWTTRWVLSDDATKQAFRRVDPRHKPIVSMGQVLARQTSPNWGGSTLVVSRAAWESVGGFDERFTEWGHEDQAMWLALGTLAPGGTSRINGTVWHLWHPKEPGAGNGGSPTGAKLHQQYTDAFGQKTRMQLLVRG